MKEALRQAGLALLVLLIILSIYVSYTGKVRMAIVDGRSMEPLLHTGDVVFIRKMPADRIKPGDIVVYNAGTRYIIHRVLNVFQVNGQTCYLVKGDNNPYPDPGFPSCNYEGIPYNRVVGVVVSYHNTTLKVPYIGGFSVAVKGGEKY